MLITTIISLLLSNAVAIKNDKSMLYCRTTIKSLLVIGFLAFACLYIIPLIKGIGILGGLFHITTITQAFGLFIILISALILTLNSFFPRKLYDSTSSSLYKLINLKLVYDKNLLSNKMGQQFRIIEYSLIIAFIICGALFLVGTNDLVSMFLSIELQSYGLYILSTLYRDSESATASGLTYFLLGGLSSCFILLGSALLYINSGTTSMENIYIIASITETIITSIWYQPYYIHLSLIILVVGFLFKISAAPFHFWSPDVYDGIPTIVTTYVAIIAKISIFAFFIELVYYTEHAIFEFSWKNILLVSSLLSLIVGSLLGLTQFRIKRLYAYSTINHVGFILLALSINTTESIQSYIFYIFQYSLSNLNAFMILIAIGYSLYKYIYNSGNSSVKEVNIINSIYKSDSIGEQNNLPIDNPKREQDNLYIDNPTGEQYKNNSSMNNTVAEQDKNNLPINNNNTDKHKIQEDRNNSPIQLLNEIKGYFYINPFIAISLAITLFSFAGIPPMIGFFGKQMILSAALDSGYIFMSLIAILTSVISAAYYLNVIKEIFFFKSKYIINPSISKIKVYLLSFYGLLNTLTYSKVINYYKHVSSSNITLNSALSGIISVLTLLLSLFIYMPEEWFNVVNILTLILFKS